MNNHNIITQVSQERWQQAQAWERDAQKKIAAKGDDYNYWWFDKFDGYRAIHGRQFADVLEVGCGPNTNTRMILPFIEFERLWLEDPLIETYLKKLAKLIHLPATHLIDSLEDLSLADSSMNLVICINVLDHVQDAEKCMEQMKRVLAPGGVLIIGQDLSNEEDYKLCPESWADVGHPIKLDVDFFDRFLPAQEYNALYDVLLDREQGRNPKCHYGTMCWIGEKI